MVFVWGLREHQRLAGSLGRGAALPVFLFLVTLSRGTTPSCLAACAGPSVFFPSSLDRSGSRVA